jgi:hypothetical protein
MSNVIQFLESLGSNPAKAHFATAAYAAAVASLDVGDAQRQALLDRDHSALNDLLGGREKMMCMVWLPAEDESMADTDDQLLLS